MITRTYTSLNLLLPTSFDPLSEETRRRLAAELAALFPAAVQCGSCGFGPVDRVACEDLASLHGLEYLGGQDDVVDEVTWFHLAAGTDRPVGCLFLNISVLFRHQQPQLVSRVLDPQPLRPHPKSYNMYPLPQTYESIRASTLKP